jgi:predicted alpha/beta hydrolase
LTFMRHSASSLLLSLLRATFIVLASGGSILAQPLRLAYFDIMVYGNQHQPGNAREWRRHYKEPVTIQPQPQKRVCAGDMEETRSPCRGWG